MVPSLRERHSTGEFGFFGRALLVAGAALGLLAPTLHSATLVRAGSSLDMGFTARAATQVLVVAASLAGVLLAGRAVDMWGTRRVVLWCLPVGGAGGAVLLAAPCAWMYWAGLAVESAAIMGVVLGCVAAVPTAHLTGRIRHAVAAAFAAFALALIAGVMLALAAGRLGGWRAVEAVPALMCLILYPGARRLRVLKGPPAVRQASVEGFASRAALVVVLGAGLQAAPLRNWLDAEVMTLLALSLIALHAVAGGERPGQLMRRRRNRERLGRGGRHRAATVVAGGIWGFGQSALATILLVSLSGVGAGQAASLVAWTGFGVGSAVAGFTCLRQRVSPRAASALGLTLAAVSVALLSTLSQQRPVAATAMATGLSVAIGFGIILAQIAWVTEYLSDLPVSQRGVAASVYPAAVILGGAAVSATPYETVLAQEARTDTISQLLWITVTGLALAAVVLSRSAVSLAVAGAAAVQYVLVTTLSSIRYAQRPLAMVVFVLTGVIVGIAVWISGRQSARLARTQAGATALQRAVLRPIPRHLGTLDLEGLYRPAATESGIGGDFYDVSHTAGRSRILLGDVRGKGLEALQIVNDVLGCFRSRTHDTQGLADLATHLDQHLARTASAHEDTELFATAILIEHEDGSGEVRILNCGHLPPLLLGPGRAETLALPALLPLGFGVLDPAHDPAPSTVPLAPGTVLLLYTDGLSEARDASGAFYPLDERLRHAPADPARLVRHLVSDATQWTHRLTDDIALITLSPRHASVPPP
ncbi:serine/threonine-protein phosphatase [Streptomyces sp. col6]|uniref:SpoIIE family protein phosphatase n=1 Tax=Streptomyces sp. col6 TaxID=2478958 RepID=UPI0011CD66C1|nr:SpoIIE family protein phosphatase [Streptomyces sp. col6]TXS04943.1 serine/threonine-protein phosphatase [Streptomyces sp. col6]